MTSLRPLARSASLAAAVAGCALLVGCPPFPATPCAQDSDCPRDYSCAQHKHYCQPRALSDAGALEGGSACGVHADCGAGSECVDGVCRARDPGCVAELALGVAHSCARDFSGQLFCWGRNGSGEVGDGAHEHRDTPSLVIGLAPVAQIAAGFDFTCARTTSGEVWCWGRNQFGQLGVGTGVIEHLVPQQVTDLAAVIELRASHYHACARTVDGEVWCWGHNENGQLGDNTTQGRDRPVRAQLPDDLEIMALAPGGYHNCVLTSTGRVWCWGGTWGGQLGDGVTGTMRIQPEEVPGLDGVIMIGSGEEHSCALTATGTLYCWGATNTSFGQIGEGAPDGSSVPVEVVGLADVVDVSVGQYHNCARLRGGAVRCWGYNHVGQLGDESHSSNATPVTPRFSIESTALAVVAGGSHSCARMNNGAVYCWGDNNWGQIGNGDTTVALSPVGVTGIANVVEVAAGGYHSCAVTSAPAVHCWGLNNSGQLGIGSFEEHDRPQAVSLPLTGGEVHVRTGYYHSCAFDDAAWCWGSNVDGELGTGDQQSSQVPRPVAGLPGPVVDMALGFDHSCALNAADEVYCWGSNSHQEIGDGTAQRRLSPTRVSGLPAVVEISARIWHTCARTATGEVWCWGWRADNINGLAPHRIGDLTGVVSVSAGGGHSCAVDGGGRGWCWGLSGYGALGDGTLNSSIGVPVAVATITDLVQISASWNNTCARASTGQVHCWGANDVGELGTGSTASINSPGQVLGLGTALQLSAAELHTCAVVTGGAAACWGSYSHGQLGSGQSSPTLKPVEVVNLPCPGVSP